jgi:hypothetical protein
VPEKCGFLNVVVRIVGTGCQLVNVTFLNIQVLHYYIGMALKLILFENKLYHFFYIYRLILRNNFTDTLAVISDSCD